MRSLPGQHRDSPSRPVWLIRNVPLAVACLYAAVSATWIVFSDRLVGHLARDFTEYQLVQTYKGTVFICASAVLMYVVLNAAWTRMTAAYLASSESERRLQLALSCAGGGIWELRFADGIPYFGYVSPELSTRLGLGPRSGQSLDAFYDKVHPDDRDIVRRTLEEALGAGGERPFGEKYRIRSTAGEYRWVQTRGAVVFSDSGAAERVIGVSLDVSEQVYAQEQLEALMRYDALTGLVRPQKFVGDCDDRLRGLAPGDMVGVFQIRPLGVEPLLNEAETLEDAEILLRISERLNHLEIPGLLVSRIAPDVFAVATPAFRHVAGIHGVLSEILDALSEPLPAHGLLDRVTFAVGGTVHPQDGASAAMLLRNSGQALDTIAPGLDTRVLWFTDGLDAAFRRRSELVRDLRTAVEAGEITCHFQPLIDLRSGRTAGFEALARWTRRDGGPVPPDEFIGLAEQFGQIRAIGEHVLREACAAAAGWQGRIEPPPFVAVNVSPVQLEDPAFPALVARVLAEHALSPACLELEITESALTSDPEAAAERLADLRRLGVSIAIDDFGTGYSSLGLLSRLPFTRLKIDRCFISAADDRPDNFAVVDAVIDLCRRLTLSTTAEGVETKAQADHLADKGVDIAQGYHFSRPVPLAKANDLVARDWFAPDEARIASTA